MIKIIENNILFSEEKYIAHITNCITPYALGLAKTLFDKYPYADIYSSRKSPDIPGTISIKGNGENQRFIINMNAQYYPGRPKYPDSDLDGYKAREKFFHKCLIEISKVSNISSIAFPYFVGCGLAGGNWDYYFGTIENFAKYIFDQQKAITYIYKI